MSKPPSISHILRTNANARRVLIGFLVVLAIYLTLKVFSNHEDTSSVNVSHYATGTNEVKRCLQKWGASHLDQPGQLTANKDGCPLHPPPELLDAYTQGGQIEVVEWWKCQTGPEYHKAHEYTKEQIDEQVDRVSNRLSNYYGVTDLFLYKAMDEHPIKGKSVVIMGSQRPIYEAVCLVFGGSTCTTIDFQPITIPHYPRFTTMTLDQYDKSPTDFDAAISISSFEHDGLGRYGDPLRPTGDLDMMLKMKCIVKPNGILYLSVPIAKDKIVWNMHRVYGRIRLPKLIEDWTLLEIYADDHMYDRWTGCDANREGDYQPIFVLKNAKPQPGHNLKVLNKYLKDTKPGSCFSN